MNPLMEFSVRSAIRLGWETFKARPWFFIGASAIIIFAHLVASVLSTVFDFGGSYEDPSILADVADVLLSAPIDMGVIAFFLAAHADPKTVRYPALWQHRWPYWKFIGAYLLASIAMLVGLILLIVPGVIAAVVLMFSTIVVIDQGLGPIEAMKESVRISRGHFWPLLGLGVLLTLITVAGILALGVGLLIALPVIMIALVHAYRVLLHKAGPPPVKRMLTA